MQSVTVAAADYDPTQASTGETVLRVKNEHFDLDKVVELELKPGEKRRMSLRVYPKAIGSIKVAALAYTLFESIPTRHEFLKRGKRLNDTKEQRLGKVYGPDKSLILEVMSPMPLLDVMFHAFPATLISGQVVRGVLEISNKGLRALSNLKLKTSHPTFVCVGAQEDLDRDMLAWEPSNGVSQISLDHFENRISKPGITQIYLPAADSSSTDSSPESPRSTAHGVLASGST
ncbi:Trafficking protein particle complex 8, partial [Gonapodya sp. JEL0774]